MATHTALITGASRGLGLEVARAYARRGVRLILTARGAEALARAADELQLSTEVVALPGDVGDMDHLERLIAAGESRIGAVDVLINNASELGPTPMPELECLPIAELADILRVNVLGPLKLMQLVLPGMRSRGSGLIVNVTSDAAREAYPTWGGYGASKAALEQLSRVLAAEVEGTGIRVLALDPGDMDTDMHRAAEPGVDLSHLPTPDLIAPAFVRLLDEHVESGRLQAQQLVAAATA